MFSFFKERADRIRRRTAGTGFDGSEFSENSNTSSILNDENSHLLDTSDIHQKGRNESLHILRNLFLYLVITMLRTNENSWPFLEPVTEELAPNYFTIIKVN
jgi:hypothetical protein